MCRGEEWGDYLIYPGFSTKERIKRMRPHSAVRSTRARDGWADEPKLLRHRVLH